jgi:hypothetical protein
VRESPSPVKGTLPKSTAGAPPMNWYQLLIAGLLAGILFNQIIIIGLHTVEIYMAKRP